MNPLNQKPIYKVSSSFLTSFQGCSKRIQRAVVERLEANSGVTSIEQLFGSALHSFREHYVRFGYFKAMDHAIGMFNQGMSNIYSIADKKAFLNEEYLRSVCNTYTALAPNRTEVDGLSVCFNGNDNTPLVEEYFSIPVIETSEFELHLSGKIDAIGIIGRHLVIEDIKTTSQSRTEMFFQRFKYSPQMRIYAYVIDKLAEVLGEDSPIGSLRISNKDFAVSIHACFLSKSKVVFERSNLITYSKEETVEFASLLEKQLLSIASIIQSGVYAKDGTVTEACSDFLSKCPFYEPCHSVDEQLIIKNNYKKRL